MMINYETKRQTTVPMHRKDLPKGTERMIYKQAGLLKQSHYIKGGVL